MCVNCREEQENLNVWVAYLNLENMYGTHESLTEVFERAVKHNDPLKIHQQLITIYIHSGKIEVCSFLLHNMRLLQNNPHLAMLTWTGTRTRPIVLIVPVPIFGTFFHRTVVSICTEPVKE